MGSAAVVGAVVVESLPDSLTVSSTSFPSLSVTSLSGDGGRCDLQMSCAREYNPVTAIGQASTTMLQGFSGWAPSSGPFENRAIGRDCAPAPPSPSATRPGGRSDAHRGPIQKNRQGWPEFLNRPHAGRKPRIAFWLVA